MNIYDEIKTAVSDSKPGILPNEVKKILNSVVRQYNGWKTPQEISKLWNILSNKFGIDILITGYPQKSAMGGKSWTIPFEYEGHTVTNSKFIYQVYEGNGNTDKNEYNMYFS